MQGGCAANEAVVSQDALVSIMEQSSHHDSMYGHTARGSYTPKKPLWLSTLLAPNAHVS